MSLLDRIRGLFGGAGGRNPIEPTAELPFGTGDRVVDTWGNEAVVTEIDLAAEHGMGRIRLRYDDGRELSQSVVAHDLKTVRARE